MSASKPSGDQLAALWQSGIALDPAWIEFARSFDRFAYTALRTFPANDRNDLASHPRYVELQNWLPGTWEARQQMLLATTITERAHLMDEIYAERLWAIGFQYPCDGVNEPVRVPREHFFFVGGVGTDVDIDWDRNRLTAGGKTYFEIRVVKSPIATDHDRVEEPQLGPVSHASGSPPAVRPPLTDDNERGPSSAPAAEAWRIDPESPATSKRKGRPSTDNEIRSKVRELLSKPHFQAMKNRLEQAREVRALLKGEHTRDVDDMQGYMSSTIKRIIGEVANEPGRTDKTE